MEQTATGVIVIGWKLVLAVVAGIPILTTCAVYLLARFTSTFDAYAGERAKLLAQFHNLDRLLEQTAKLTATTETIKTSLSNESEKRKVVREKLEEAYHLTFEVKRWVQGEMKQMATFESNTERIACPIDKISALIGLYGAGLSDEATRYASAVEQFRGSVWKYWAETHEGKERISSERFSELLSAPYELIERTQKDLLQYIEREIHRTLDSELPTPPQGPTRVSTSNRG